MLEKCVQCSREKNCKGPVESTVYGKGGVLVLLSSPTKADDDRGRLCSVGFNKDHVLGWLEQNYDNYAIDSAVRCSGATGGKAGANQIDSCRWRWKHTLKKFKPKTILVLGSNAVESIFGRSVKIGKVAGTSSRIEISGQTYNVVFGVDPQSVSKDKDQKGGFSEKLVKSYEDTWDLLERVHKEGLEERPKTNLITDFKKVINFIGYLKNDYKGLISYDYETYGDKNTLRPELNKVFKILCCGVGIEDGAYCFPIEYPSCFTPEQTRKIYFRWSGIVKLGDKNRTVAHNAKYEHKCNLKRLKKSSFLKDTMMMSVSLDETQSAALGQVASRYGIKWANYKTESDQIQSDPINTPLEELLEYGALDGYVVYLLHNIMSKKIIENNLETALHHKELSALSLAMVEYKGMHVDKNTLIKVQRQLEIEKEKNYQEFLSHREIKNVEMWAMDNIKSFKKKPHFNPKSAPQMQRLLLDELGLRERVDPSKKKNKDGSDSFNLDKRILEPFREEFPVINSLLKYRSIESMFSGFINKWENFTCPKGCVHTQLNQDVVVTGRLSSTEPNLQNIPKRDAETGGLAIVRKIFDSRYQNGWCINLDYKQIEPRLVAGISMDKIMIKALVGGFDLHTYASSQIFGVSYDEVTKIQRDLGKRMNLGIIYGQTEHGLSAKTQLTLNEARELMAEYERRFPQVAEWKQNCHREVSKNGMIRDMFGAIRHLPNARSSNKWTADRAKRQSANFVIQSTANTFCLIGVYSVQKALIESGLKAVVSGTVHDSIHIECTKNDVDEVCKLAKIAALCHNTAPYWRDKGVPMAVDIECGPNLYELKEWKNG